MSTPFTISGKLEVPPDAGQPNAPIPFGLSSNYDSALNGVEFTFLGSGTKAIDLGTIPSAGLKGLLIKVDAAGPTPGVTPAPIFVRLNGASATGQEEISPGGFKAMMSPNPSAGITALTIVYASDVRVRIWAYG